MPRWVEADSVGGTFLGYFWTNYVRNELDWGSRYHTNIEFSCTVAVMEKLVDGEKRQEDENQIGARFGACMWICTQAAISLRPKDMKNFVSKIHSITEAANKTWDFLCQTHQWIPKSSVEFQESRVRELLQDDLEVPCIVQ